VAGRDTKSILTFVIPAELVNTSVQQGLLPQTEFLSESNQKMANLKFYFGLAIIVVSSE
jgi:hypothetical protein